MNTMKWPEHTSLCIFCSQQGAGWQTPKAWQLGFAFNNKSPSLECTRDMSDVRSLQGFMWIVNLTLFELYLHGTKC